MSKLSDLAWRVGGFKGSLALAKGSLKNIPPCASGETIALALHIDGLLFNLQRLIEIDYQEAKKKIQSSSITAK